MPREYEEIVLYLEGKRSLDQLLLEDEEDEKCHCDATITAPPS